MDREMYLGKFSELSAMWALTKGELEEGQVLHSYLKFKLFMSTPICHLHKMHHCVVQLEIWKSQPTLLIRSA